jgi:glutaredoxin
LFEELALGTGRSSKVENLPELPPGLEPPPAAPEGGDVVVYKTDWCGVCKQLTAYLDRKGVKYVAKDIEKDPAAAAEMRAKAEKKGVKTGSVPIVDVRGELMVGFDRGRLEKLL